MTTAQRLGARLRELRKAAGLSQAELAYRMGAAQPHLCRIEQGSSPNPHLGSIERAAQALGMRLVITIEAGEPDPRPMTASPGP